MKLGFIGLGRMGSNMVQNLLDHKHKVVALNRSPQPTRALARKGAIPAFSIEELINKLSATAQSGAGGRGAGRRASSSTHKLLSPPKIIWLMIPAGKPIDQTISQLLLHLKKGDIIIDGGNSYYEDSQRRNKMLKKKGINYLDCGTSGGIEGARKGACMMVGGDKKVFKKVEALFRDMCVKNGYGYMGLSGSGHFVKGIHNGIEYGMMGAINEGFKAHEKHQKKLNLDLKEIAKVYSHGSIIESHLMTWLYNSFRKEHYLDNISCEVPKGETENEMRALTKKSKMPILKAAIKMRKDSRHGTVCGDFIAAMRNQFGGHKVKARKKK